MSEITDILSELRIPYKTAGEHHHARDGWIQLDCPFCGKGSGKYHMGYSLSGNFVNCWRCGRHRVADTLAESANVSVRVAIGLLKALTTRFRQETRTWGKLCVPSGIITDLPGIHQRYLRDRGFDPAKIQQLWGVCALGIHADLAWRLFIPIYFQGKVASWTTRSVVDDEGILRYVSAKEKEERIPHKTLLYGEDYARHVIIIHEGPTDVWRTGPGAVATFGTGYKQAQFNRMIAYPKRIVCFDNDPLAQKRARKLADDLACFPGETMNVRLDAEDAGSASRKEIYRLRKMLQ